MNCVALYPAFADGDNTLFALKAGVSQWGHNLTYIHHKTSAAAMRLAGFLVSLAGLDMVAGDASDRSTSITGRR